MGAVFRGMSQEELETQYNARGSVPDFDAEMARYRGMSDHCYATCNVQRDISYGSGKDEKFNFFPAAESGGPVFVFIHGGYWRFLGRTDSAFMAGNFTRHGISVAVVEYTLSPNATLDRIVDQVRRSIAFIYRQADVLGFDASRLFVGGSSAGAHLCAMALATDWPGKFGLNTYPIKGVLLASGLYDLEPVRLCAPNTWLKLDVEAATRNSPIHHKPSGDVDVLVTWGGYETDEFKRQSQEYAQGLKAAGFTPQTLEVADRNHFDIVTDLADPARQLFRTFAKIMLDQV